ncbi:uncharacterized protein METZ01_LOCUS422905, partial [marine metagenome]
MAKAFAFGLPAGRPVTLRGKTAGDGRVKVYWQGKRISVTQTSSGNWSANLASHNPDARPTLVFEGAKNNAHVNFTGLCETTFQNAAKGNLKLGRVDSIRIDGIRLDWEARYA